VPPTSLRRLTAPKIQALARVEHGVYRFEDQEFEAWVRGRKKWTEPPGAGSENVRGGSFNSTGVTCSLQRVKSVAGNRRTRSVNYCSRNLQCIQRRLY